MYFVFNTQSTKGKAKMELKIKIGVCLNHSESRSDYDAQLKSSGQSLPNELLLPNLALYFQVVTKQFQGYHQTPTGVEKTNFGAV